MVESQPLIAREGWPHVAIAVVVALLATAFLGGWSLLFWALAVFVIQFFRDPPRHTPPEPGIAVSPADGRVLLVQKARDPYLQRDALKISVFMNVINVHSNRSPVEGIVKQRWYHGGSFLNASLDKSSDENERTALWIRTDDGIDLTCVQVAGFVARRILCYANAGDRLSRGQRYGFIRFGSRVDLYLPVGTAPRVSIGDKVTAGETVFADLPKPS
ncbi:MAG TPA: phosphatidylserine decarboxylase [Burkholderiales bacterium]|nr:phosphatidylserine decarboxylase [Burkholderiales bacterium]